MTFLPPAILTTAQLINGLAASARNALELAKASADHGLKGAVNELYNAVFEVQGRVLDLDEENRRLKEVLARKDEIDGPDDTNGYFFIVGKPDHPLCPKCFQSNPSHSVFLSPPRNVNDGRRRICAVCGYKHWEMPAIPPSIRMIPREFAGD